MVVAMTPLALERIRLIIPFRFRQNIVADSNGILSIIGISNRVRDSFYMLHRLAIAITIPTVFEVDTGPEVPNGGGLGFPFEYSSNLQYTGFTQTNEESPSGNIRVTLADGSGLASGEPMWDAAGTTAHELLGHALLYALRMPYEHELSGPPPHPVNAYTNWLYNRAMQLNSPWWTWQQRMKPVEW
jgi:hypothetical protein